MRAMSSLIVAERAPAALSGGSAWRHPSHAGPRVGADGPGGSARPDRPHTGADDLRALPLARRRAPVRVRQGRRAL
ncbi:hypothetical protein ACFSM7_03655 [Clavibacter michiganensis subsp. tessellarius]|uniref:hypothetical protein n=1 Tax=Clavibacter tessellarius TaxID=31965 RepID=UPI00362904C2